MGQMAVTMSNLKSSFTYVYAGGMKAQNFPLSAIKLLFIGFILISSYLLVITVAHAQAGSLNQTIDLTYAFTNIDPAAQDGDILFSSGQNLNQANSPYSNKIFGVLETNALLVYRSASGSGQPVARNGIAQVNVTTIN